jgi:hypothetical protein
MSSWCRSPAARNQHASPINARRKPAVQLTPTNDRSDAPLGDGFLVTERDADPRAAAINIVLNWTTPTAR